MENEEAKNKDTETSRPQAANTPHVVMADTVKAEEVPTLSIGDLQTINSLRPEIAIHPVTSTEDISMPAPLVVQPAEYRRSIGEWLQIWRDGLRPAYFTLSLVPALVGSVLAWRHTVTQQTPLGQFHFLQFFVVVAALILIQSGANLVNDYYDYLRGVDRSNPFGPGGLIQQGLIKPIRVLICGLALLILGAISWLMVAATGGLIVYLSGLSGLLCAYFYSATSRSLSSLALGELVSFGVFGPLITIGAYLVQSSGQYAPEALIYSLPWGFFAAAIIHVNNMRDIEADEHAHKHTLATILGLRWSKLLYLLLLAGAYAVIICLGVPQGMPHLLLLPLWTLPGLAVAVSGLLRAQVMAALHVVMRQTLRLEANFALLLTIALVAITLIPVLPAIPPHLLPW